MSIDVGSEQRVNRAGQSFIDDVRAVLHDVPGEPSPDARLDVDRLNSSVFRLKSRATGAIESVVVKRLTAAVAERNELTAEHPDRPLTKEDFQRWRPGAFSRVCGSGAIGRPGGHRRHDIDSLLHAGATLL